MARTAKQGTETTDPYRQMLFEIIDSYDDLAFDACRRDTELMKRLQSLRLRVKLKTVIDVTVEKTERLEATCR